MSVKDVMAELGQQPGALYFHVTSKQHLLLELVKIGTEFHRFRIQQALLEAGREPGDQLRAMVEAHVHLHLEYRALARVTSREFRSLSAEQQEAVDAIRAETGRLFSQVVDRGVRNGAFTVTNPRLALQAISSMGVRAAEWWTPESPDGMDEVSRSYADYAVKVLS